MNYEWTDPDTGIHLLALPENDLRPETIETAKRHNRTHPLTVKGCAGREILRLAAEVERLKATEANLPTYGASARALERARIRRELVLEIRFSFAAQVAARGGGVTTEALELAQLSVLAALDRIVPGEG